MHYRARSKRPIVRNWNGYSRKDNIAKSSTATMTSRRFLERCKRSCKTVSMRSTLLVCLLTSWTRADLSRGRCEELFNEALSHAPNRNGLSAELKVDDANPSVTGSGWSESLRIDNG